MEKFFIVENGMISEDYILAPNIECALKHPHIEYNKNDIPIGKITIKRKEDIVSNICIVSDEDSLQNSLSNCQTIFLKNDIDISGQIYTINLVTNHINIVSEPSTNKRTISLLEKNSNMYIVDLENHYEVTFNNIIFNIDNKYKTDIFNIGDNHKLTFNNSEINITNTPNIINGRTNSVVTIKDSSLTINNTPSDGLGIKADTVNLKDNHFIEFKNNEQLFSHVRNLTISNNKQISFHNNEKGIKSDIVHLKDNDFVEFTNNKLVFNDVSNLTIRNNNQFNYFDNSHGIQAKQINIISNKQMSFQNNEIGIQSDTVHLEDNHLVEFTNNKLVFNDVSNLTISNSETHITNSPNIIKGKTNSVVTIKDSSLNINNISSDGIGILSDTVHLERNHLVEFKNNEQLFNVSNLTISNNNEFIYLDNSVGISAAQINIISNKQMSFNRNNSILALISANTIDISNSNLLFYKNTAFFPDGTLLLANNDIIFDGGSLVALNNTLQDIQSIYSLIYTYDNIIFKNKPWFDISTNLSAVIKMNTKYFSGNPLLAYNTNLDPYKGNNLDVSMVDSSLCSYNSPYCRSEQYNNFCFSSTSQTNICIDTETNLGQCYPKSSSVTCTQNYPSTTGCRCHMSPPLKLKYYKITIN